MTREWDQRMAYACAQTCAWLGGMLLLCTLLVTSASVLGRNLLGVTLVGDFEATGLACGVAIALFMPWCQLRRGHIVVDVFTAQATPRTLQRLDRWGALCLALCMLTLAWRTTVGGIHAQGNFSTSMLLGLPHWWVYAGMVPPLLATAGIALWQAFFPQRTHP